MSTSSYSLSGLAASRFEELRGRTAEIPCFEMLGDGVGMRRLRMQVERIGPHFRMVLVRGEMGTGKELAARALHGCSLDREGPFVVCHAAALGDVTDSDADGRIRELMRTAYRGTLFFDGIEEMPLAAQSRLVRAIEQRMGTRMIASAAQDLRLLTASGRFRQDLYYRIGMVEIVLEPLRERLDEIPGLAMSFVKRFSRLYEKRAERIADDAMERLLGYDWPGNIRELENVMRNGVLQCEGEVLEAGHLASLLEMRWVPVHDGGMNRMDAPDRLQDVVEEHVLRVLKRCAGNKLRAAELLGISRSTLYRMLEGCSGSV
jgi:DNA-binding NtrC family response regulator